IPPLLPISFPPCLHSKFPVRSVMECNSFPPEADMDSIGRFVPRGRSTVCPSREWDLVDQFCRRIYSLDHRLSLRRRNVERTIRAALRVSITIHLHLVRHPPIVPLPLRSNQITHWTMTSSLPLLLPLVPPLNLPPNTDPFYPPSSN
ncbi:hypothetical protein PFISCL1PPCAC_24084, partial [Pristionchus fissidentatus]